MLIDRFPGIHHNISIHRMGRTATIIVGSFIFIILLIFKLTRFWRYKDITMGRPVGIGKTPGQPYSFDNIPFKIKIVIEGSALTFIDIIQSNPLPRRCAEKEERYGKVYKTTAAHAKGAGP